MTLNKYQTAALRTAGEHSSNVDAAEFTKYIKSCGAKIHGDSHIYTEKGKPMSRQARNGYYVVRKSIKGKTYYFMEHRIIWCWHNGEIPEDKVINHIDFDRANNHIENLELVTQLENVKHTIESGRARYAKGCESGKALLNEDEVKLVRYLRKNGWSQQQVFSLFKDMKNENTVSRVVTGARYGVVPDAADVISIYPMLVTKVANQDLPKDERIKNAAMGLCGEAGEASDLLKKYFYQGADLDVNDLILELGDVMFYICWLCNEFEVDFAELCYANMDKLTKRYPDGFDPIRANNRAEGDL